MSQDYLDLQGALISPLCPRTPSSELLNNPLKDSSSIFMSSSEDNECDLSRSDTTLNNRDSKTSENLIPLLEKDDNSVEYDENAQENSYENIRLEQNTPLINEGISDGKSGNSQADFSKSSNTSLPGSRVFADHNNVPLLDDTNCDGRSRNSQGDFSQSSNTSLPGSRIFADHNNDEATESLLENQSNGEGNDGLDASFSGQSNDRHRVNKNKKTRKPSVITEV